SHSSPEVFLLTKEEHASLFQNDPRLKVLSFQSNVGNIKQTAQLWRTAKVLRQTKFDLVLDLQRNPRSLLLRLLSGSKKVVAYPKGHLHRKSFVKKKNFEKPYTHAVDRYNMALKKAGITTSNRLPKVVLSQEEERLAQSFLQERGVSLTRPLVGIHFGAKHPTKRWGDEKFAELTRMLAKEVDLNILVIPSKEDLSQEKLFRQGGRNIFWTGASSLRELKAVISRCEVLICNDSGVMHVAVGLGVPVVAVFGPTHPCLGFYPLGEDDILLSSYEYCSPCSLHGEEKCFRDKKYCMENIPVDEVFDATVSILSKRRENVREGRP
ncbi:MAG: glycosyltransferase family 9 protein, partial [Candidatus Zixiibacteriota bacterium]